MSSITLIGAGGHARMVADALAANGINIDSVIDPKKPDWIDVTHNADDRSVSPSVSVVIGLGGVTPDALQKRLGVLEALIARGCEAPVVIHPSAMVSPSAAIGQGSQIAAGAIVQAFAKLGVGVIVNSGAIVEHDAVVGAGSHIAPGAIVLGGAVVGTTCMIGAGAVILPEAPVADSTLVKSLTRTNGSIEGKQHDAR